MVAAIGRVTTPEETNETPAKPGFPYGVCQACVRSKGTIEAMAAEMATLHTSNENARVEIESMSRRLQASSGVTVLGRQDDTIRRSQHAEEIQRRANDNLERENRILRELCDQHKINYELALTLTRANK